MNPADELNGHEGRISRMILVAVRAAANAMTVLLMPGLIYLILATQFRSYFQPLLIPAEGIAI